MASQAKYNAAAAAAMAIVNAHIKALGGFAEMEAGQYVAQIQAVVNEAAKAALDAADGVA